MVKNYLIRNTAKQAAEQHQLLLVLEHKTAILVDIQKNSSCRPLENCLKHRDHCSTLLNDSRGEFFW